MGRANSTILVANVLRLPDLLNRTGVDGIPVRYQVILIGPHA